MKKPTIAVVFGSRSAEHDVSIVTALGSIIRPLEMINKYNVVPVYISKNGNWYSDNKLKNIRFFSDEDFEEKLKSLKPITISLNNGLSLLKQGISQKKISINLVFPSTHGTFGEDGYLMGLLEMANVPYVGCEVSASVIAMDKILAKKIVESENIASTPWTWFKSSEFDNDPLKILKKIESSKLKYPLFVKPAHLGSSIGITMVKSEIELQNAIEVAAYYDEKIIIEQAVNNLQEVTLPIMGNDNPVPSILESPLTDSDKFFDFEAKYLGTEGKKGSKKGSDGSQGYSQIPAELPENLYKLAEEMGIAVYKALGCSGIARVDMLIDTEQNKVYFNEVNPLPGSLYAHNWAKKGVSNVSLVEKLISLAFDRFEKKNQFQTTFQSSFLKNK